MKEYKRVCKICGKTLVYGSYSSYWLAEKNNSNCKKCASKLRAKRKCDLSPLLEETPEAYYWVGFILADGHLEDGRVSFHLGEKDIEQVKKFSRFIKWTGKFNNKGKLGIGFAAKHTEIVEKLCEKFDIKQNKTYNPPNTILKHNKKLLKCLFIGFIDGDGCISKQHKRNDCFIRIKIHKSWEKILKEFCEIIEYDTNHVKINKEGYCEFTISDSQIIKKIKKDTLNLPVLKRKWNKIDNNFVSRNVTSKLLKEKIIKMLKNGEKGKIISEKLKISQSLVSKIKKNYVAKS